MWSLPGRAVHSTQTPRRPQWWDCECHDVMASRNAAHRLWRRERTPEPPCTKKIRFHHLVPRKKAQFWNIRLNAREQLACDNPGKAAQNTRQQMRGGACCRVACARRTLLAAWLKCPACLDAWRVHFRTVPLDAFPAVLKRPDSQAPEVEITVQWLRASMLANVGDIDFPFSEAELAQVLQELPCDRSLGPE